MGRTIADQAAALYLLRQFQRAWADQQPHYAKDSGALAHGTPGEAISADVVGEVIVWLGESLDRLESTGELDEKCSMHLSGEPVSKGAMLAASGGVLDAGSKVFIAAQNERALRELLCLFPRRKTALVFYLGEWGSRTIAEFLEGSVIWRQGEINCFRGIKRGGGSKAVQRLISGKKDPVIEEFRRLDSLKAKMEQSKILLEGSLPVRRALQDGLPVDKVLYTVNYLEDMEGKQIISKAREAQVGLYGITPGLMAAITDIRPVPHVMASVHAALPDASQFHVNAGTTLLITDGVANPDNLGMLLRTADAAGMEGVVVMGQVASPFHKNCIRSARGSVGRIPLFQCTSEEEFLRRLRDQGFQIIGSSAKASADFYKMALKAPIAFIVGSESEGIRKNILGFCTDTVRIPMASGQSSLNVGVAAGVLLFEWRRQMIVCEA